jgi:hypothetical protein
MNNTKPVMSDWSHCDNPSNKHHSTYQVMVNLVFLFFIFQYFSWAIMLDSEVGTIAYYSYVKLYVVINLVAIWWLSLFDFIFIVIFKNSAGKH